MEQCHRVKETTLNTSILYPGLFFTVCNRYSSVCSQIFMEKSKVRYHDSFPNIKMGISPGTKKNKKIKNSFGCRGFFRVTPTQQFFFALPENYFYSNQKLYQKISIKSCIMSSQSQEFIG